MRLLRAFRMRIRFDRGTLVLDRAEPGLAPGILDGASWDSELAAWRMPAEQLSGLRVRLSDDGCPSHGRHPTATPRDNLGLAAAPLVPARCDSRPGARRRPRRARACRPARARRSRPSRRSPSSRSRRSCSCRRACCSISGRARSRPAARIRPAGSATATTSSRRSRSRRTRARSPGRRGSATGSAWSIVDEAHHVGAWCPARGPRDARRAGAARPDRHAAGRSHRHALDAHSRPGGLRRSRSHELAGNALAPFDARDRAASSLTPDERADYRTLRGRFAAVYASSSAQPRHASWREFTARATHGRGPRRTRRRGAPRGRCSPTRRRSAALRELLGAARGRPHARLHGRQRDGLRDRARAAGHADHVRHRRAERERMLERFRAGESPVLVSAQVLDEGSMSPTPRSRSSSAASGSERRHVQRSVACCGRAPASTRGSTSWRRGLGRGRPGRAPAPRSRRRAGRGGGARPPEVVP